LAFDTIHEGAHGGSIEGFFRGKEGSNNRKILSLLLSQEPLTHWTIAKRIGKTYSTVYERIRSLSDDGLLEKKSERPGTKNKQPVALWGITAYGLWVLASRRETLAMEKCAKSVMGYWKKFNQIYRLDKVKPRLLYDGFTEWLNSDDGILQFLRMFGVWPLSGEGAGLSTFRRMVDLALLYRHGEWLPILPVAGEKHDKNESPTFSDRDAFRILGEIASRHHGFRKLDAVLQDVDSPFYDYLSESARHQLFEKLRVPLGNTIAKRLAATPLLKDEGERGWQTATEGTEKLVSSLPSAEFGAEILVESDRVIIITPYPEMISDEWRKHSIVHALPTRRKQARTTRTAKNTEGRHAL
jgi:DNA-binding PadR family transcriptional regulator